MAKMDLNGDNEKDNIEQIFCSAMDMLSDDDKKLPQARYFLNFGAPLPLFGAHYHCLCRLLSFSVYNFSNYSTNK